MTASPHSLPGPGLAPGRGPVIAIIGGGASGTLAAIHLLRAAAARQYPLRIALIDRLGRHGLGEAYSTSNPAHFLNALTARMSGVAGDPDHLLRWASAAGLEGLEFLPRQAFGRYLQDTLADAQRRAAALSRLSPVTSEVLAIRPGAAGRPMRLLLADGATLEADLAILATGKPAAVAARPVPGQPLLHHESLGPRRAGRGPGRPSRRHPGHRADHAGRGHGGDRRSADHGPRGVAARDAPPTAAPQTREHPGSAA